VQPQRGGPRVAQLAQLGEALGRLGQCVLLGVRFRLEFRQPGLLTPGLLGQLPGPRLEERQPRGGQPDEIRAAGGEVFLRDRGGFRQRGDPVVDQLLLSRQFG
jgi:hypothetical protein